ncbi:hypothetical protein UFOVP1202_5 [uncultured Caudovirales phage]|uniref:Uncharacterized protein n=1 Tax=uncultured Caudovirales phage TaxID=2100421 RepID=A0A6J5R7P5_9CAUD|nr:hypothetical protein UFOVP1202_5 [uncultured Caudovirales phage]
MSFTYAQLKQAIQDYTENTETTFVSNLPLFIRLSEERILKSVQITLFRKNAQGSVTSNNQFLNCPSDFLAPFSLSYTDASGNKNFLEFKDVSFLQEYNQNPSTTGTPKYYAQFDNSNFNLAPTPNSSFVVELHYFYRPASLTDGADSGTTWLSINAELTLLYGALIEAYVFMKGDPDLSATYDKRFQESLMGLKLLGEARQVTDEYRTGMVIRAKQ